MFDSISLHLAYDPEVTEMWANVDLWRKNETGEIKRVHGFIFDSWTLGRLAARYLARRKKLTEIPMGKDALYVSLEG